MLLNMGNTFFYFTAFFVCVLVFYIFLCYTLLVICTWNKGSERMREIIFFKMLGGGNFFFITPSWVGVAFAPHFPKKLYKKCTRKKLQPGMRICSRLLSFSRFLSSRPHPPFVPEKNLIFSYSQQQPWWYGKILWMRKQHIFSYCCCCCCSPLLKNCGAVHISIQFCLANRITQYTVLFFGGVFLCDIRV